MTSSFQNGKGGTAGYVQESMADPQSVPACERPREKLLAQGVEKLTDVELVASIVGSGTRKNSVRVIATKVLAALDRARTIPSATEIGGVKGMGYAKTALLLAALELARRRLCPGPRKIAQPADVLPLVSHYGDRTQEHFLTLSLNGAHEVIAVRVVSIGLVNRTIVHPREVFADPLMDRAAAVIVAHNHPSGNLDPSREDEEITERLREAGEMLGIRLLDHIVFANGAYYSFLEHGRMH